MRYGVAIPQANHFATPDALRAMARAVEDLGFDSIWVSDHIIVPTGSSYIPEMMTEPLAVLAFLAAETKHVTLGTSVLILPYRDPVSHGEVPLERRLLRQATGEKRSLAWARAGSSRNSRR